MNDTTKETKSSGGVVINKQGDILVVSQHGTSWSLPKGHINEGENEVEAAKREIYEESGIQQLEFVKKLGEYRRYKINKEGGDDTSELKTIVMFLFKTGEQALRPVDSQNPEAQWVSVEKVSGLLTHSKDREFFQTIKEEL